jgi:hypothetical protein
VTDYCLIENWFGQMMIELRRFLLETEEMETGALLERVRVGLEASRRHHRENGSNCAGRPTWGDRSDDPRRDESHRGDLGAVIRYKSTLPTPSRREATRCSKH